MNFPEIVTQQGRGHLLLMFLRTRHLEKEAGYFKLIDYMRT